MNAYFDEIEPGKLSFKSVLIKLLVIVGVVAAYIVWLAFVLWAIGGVSHM